jgi:hypothetical protein
MSKAARIRQTNAEKQRLKREREEFETKKRKVRRITAIVTGSFITLLVLITLIGTIIYNVRMNSGNYLRQEIAASSVNIDVNGAMMNYYFNDVYNTFVDYYGSYVSYYGLDTTMSLKKQKISENESWFSYFMSGAKSNVSGILALNEAAAAEGISLSDEEIEALKTRIDNTDEAFYGRGVKKSDIYDSKLLEALAFKYQFIKQDEFKPSKSEITSIYDSDPKKYQSVDFLYYSFQWSDNGMTKEDAEEEANRLAAAKDADDFKAILLDKLAANNPNADKETLEDDLTSYNITGYIYTADDEFSEWAFGGANAGASKVIVDEENSIYKVFMLTKAPYRDESETINVRHILFSSSTYGSKEKALKKAEEVLGIYRKGDGGEEVFSNLALAYSDDDGSYYHGGLYENVTKGSMVQKFNDWCFNPIRRTGDVEIIETDYGYHIMYFVGKGLKAWETRVSNAITSEKITDFSKTVTDKYTVVFDDRVLNLIPA